MFLNKEDLPNLNNDTKNLVFNGSVILYKKKQNFEEFYFLQFNDKYFLLNSSGTAIDLAMGKININEVEDIVYFKDSFEEAINLEIQI